MTPVEIKTTLRMAPYINAWISQLVMVYFVIGSIMRHKVTTIDDGVK